MGMIGKSAFILVGIIFLVLIISLILVETGVFYNIKFMGYGFQLTIFILLPLMVFGLMLAGMYYVFTSRD